MRVLPVKVLAALRTSVPAPVAVSPPAPATTPLTVRVLPVETATEESAVSARLRLASRATSAVAARAPPARVRFVAAEVGTEPRALSAAIETVPALT